MKTIILSLVCMALLNACASSTHTHNEMYGTVSGGVETIF